MRVSTSLLFSLAIWSAQPVLAQHIAIVTYPVSGGAYGITPGPDGALWFTEPYGNHIGRITTAGIVTHFQVPTPGSFVQGITAGPDGALWFTEYVARKIGRITTGGTITEFSITIPDADPLDIAVGSDGALWFTQNCLYTVVGCNVAYIGRITTEGAITEYNASSAFQPWGITAGPDGALWFADLFGRSIGRMTTGGAMTLYPVNNYNTDGITVGPDGALWFTQLDGNMIGRITTAGAITTYPLPGSQNGCPAGITTGPDEALWFVEQCANKLGRITTSGDISIFPLPTPKGDPVGITQGPDGSLWYTANQADQVGQAVFVNATLSAAPEQGYYRSLLSFTGSGFAPGETVQIYDKGVDSGVLASAPADSNGNVGATAYAPQSPYGPRAFLAKGAASGSLAAASFSMQPGIVVHPGSGAAGSSLTATAYGFGTDENVQFYWDNPNVYLGYAKADIDGTVAGGDAPSLTVPAGAQPGVNHVYALGQLYGEKATAPFTVR